MLPEFIPNSLREAALRSFRDSLAKATEKSAEDQSEVERLQQSLQEAIKRRDASEADRKAYENLISAYLGEEDDDQDEELVSESDNYPLARKRMRLNARPKTLEIVQQAGKFLTADQIVELVTDAFGEGVIKEKTIKNAIGDLTTGNELKKHYSKQVKEYIYGPPEWFEGDVPKTEYLDSNLERSTATGAIVGGNVSMYHMHRGAKADNRIWSWENPTE